MTITATTNDKVAQINVQAIGRTYTFTRPSDSSHDAAAVAEVIRQAINGLIAAGARELQDERDLRWESDRQVRALRCQVTKLRNRLGIKP